MTDLDDYCAVTKQPVIDLLGLMFDIQTDPTKLTDVVRQVDLLIAAEAVRPSGLTGEGAVWERHGLRVLREMREAAVGGDAPRVWALFSDKEHGLFLLGNTCHGRSGW